MPFTPVIVRPVIVPHMSPVVPHTAPIAHPVVTEAHVAPRPVAPVIVPHVATSTGEPGQAEALPTDVSWGLIAAVITIIIGMWIATRRILR